MSKQAQTAGGKSSSLSSSDINGKLSRWAEKNRQGGQPRKETLELLKELLEVERQQLLAVGKNTRGFLQEAVRKLCKATGKSIAWGNQYAAMRNLVPELVDLLDLPDDAKRLNFESALQLCRMPKDSQCEEHEKSKESLRKGGTGAQKRHLQHRAKTFRTVQGKPQQGHPINDRNRLLKLSKKLQKLAVLLAGGRGAEEYLLFLDKTITAMSPDERSQLLAYLKEGLGCFVQLLEKAKTLEVKPVVPEVVICKEPNTSKPVVIEEVTPTKQSPVIQDDMVSVEKVREMIVTKTPAEECSPARSWATYVSTGQREKKENGEKKWESRIIVGHRY